jgi:hypothetical protein
VYFNSKAMFKKLIFFLVILLSVNASKAQKAPAAKAPVSKPAVTKAPVAKAPATKAPAKAPVQKGPQVTYTDAPSPNDLPFMNETWRLIAKKDVKKLADNKYVTVFPAPLQALNNRTVSMNGYMVPMKAGATHNAFMMAVVPLSQCEFCGTNGIPDMVEVHLKGSIPYTEGPLTVVGKLSLSSSIETSNVFLLDADADEYNP